MMMMTTVMKTNMATISPTYITMFSSSIALAASRDKKHRYNLNIFTNKYNGTVQNTINDQQGNGDMKKIWCRSIVTVSERVYPLSRERTGQLILVLLTSAHIGKRFGEIFYQKVPLSHAQKLCRNSSFVFKIERQRSLFDRMIYNTCFASRCIVNCPVLFLLIYVRSKSSPKRNLPCN